jgi:hypothetical protein
MLSSAKGLRRLMPAFIYKNVYRAKIAFHGADKALDLYFA